MNQFPEQSAGESKPKWLTRKEYTNQAEKKKDFWLGVGLWWGLNILMTICSWGAGIVLMPAINSSSDFNTVSNFYSILTLVLGILPWVINLGLIIFFAFTRSQIALGMLAGFGMALLITICLGVIFTVWCFYALGNSGA